MKIQCDCGNRIIDSTDGHSTKGRLIPDKAWNELWDAIDEAIELAGPLQEDKQRACMRLRKMELFQLIWQCPSCGKLFINDKINRLCSYVPADDTAFKSILNT